MEDQAILNLETGTKEIQALTPKTVKIEQVKVEPIGNKGNRKVICSVKHPDREDLIDISGVKYESKTSLRVSGLWVNLDEDEKIRKGSPLATFMAKVGARSPAELKDREIETTEDEKGYLVFKAY
jgi:hypothetical protein